jgi:hypothetical protein
MKLEHFIEAGKRRDKKFLVHFIKKLGITRTTYYNILKFRLTNSRLAKAIFFATNGKVTPNSIFDVDNWKQELKQLKAEQNLKKQSKQRFSQPAPESPSNNPKEAINE